MFVFRELQWTLQHNHILAFFLSVEFHCSRSAYFSAYFMSIVEAGADLIRDRVHVRFEARADEILT